MMARTMDTTLESTQISQIGEAAGLVWQCLHDHGPLPLNKLLKEAELPRDLLMQALGWLAREDKLHIDEERRTRVVSLR